MTHRTETKQRNAHPRAQRLSKTPGRFRSRSITPAHTVILTVLTPVHTLSNPNNSDPQRLHFSSQFSSHFPPLGTPLCSCQPHFHLLRTVLVLSIFVAFSILPIFISPHLQPRMRVISLPSREVV